jgi:DNA-binding beta-propeller fold protein YncE
MARRKISQATDAIVATISVGADAGISITPDGAKLYVVDADANSVTVVDTATNASWSRRSGTYREGLCS